MQSRTMRFNEICGNPKIRLRESSHRVVRFAPYELPLLSRSADHGERIASFRYVEREMDFITFRSVKATKYGNGLRRLC